MPQPDDALRHIFDQWVAKAEEDVQVARVLMEQPQGLANPICFHAQQAVEKYLKAFLIWHQVVFPKTHDIERILYLVEGVDEPLASSLIDVSFLTPYAADMRYPGERPEATEQDAETAFAMIHKTKAAVLSALGQH